MTQLLQTDKGANVNGRLNDGSTPLQYASRDGQLAIAEVRPVVGWFQFLTRSEYPIGTDSS